MSRYADRIYKAKYEQFQKQLADGTLDRKTAGPLIFAEVCKVLHAAVKNALLADPTLSIDKARSLVFNKTHQTEYEFRKWLLDEQLDEPLLPPKPVVKQAPTAQDVIMATIRQRVADMGKAANDIAGMLEVLRQDPVLAESLRQAASVPGGAAKPYPYQPTPSLEGVDAQPTAYATEGLRPPGRENMRGLDGSGAR
jgi:hypothetical protein